MNIKDLAKELMEGFRAYLTDDDGNPTNKGLSDDLIRLAIDPNVSENVRKFLIDKGLLDDTKAFAYISGLPTINPNTIVLNGATDVLGFIMVAD